MITKPITASELREMLNRLTRFMDSPPAPYWTDLRPALWTNGEMLMLFELIERQQAALRWALGENGDFREQRDGEGRYWWRTELRTRAALHR